MKKIILVVLISIILGIISFLVYDRFFFKPAKEVEITEINSPQVIFYDNQDELIANFEVELAQTPEEQQKGLMYREFLDKDKGMLFIYSQERLLPFWMKNTLIPLDIIYIGADKKIVNIITNAQPCQKDPCPAYASLEPAQYVLEINGGLAESLGIKEGMEANFNLP